MNRLEALQKGFQTYLFADEGEAFFHAAIVGDARVGAEKRLRIYHDAYRLRLIEALSKAYPNLGKLLGGDLFDRLARSFIDAHPSVYRNLREYGGELPKHLVTGLPSHPIAVELAAFEWTLSLAFDAGDATTIGIAELATIPPEDWGELRLKLHPAVRTLALALNTVTIWKALDENQTPPAVENAPATWLFWRRDLNPHFRSLDSLEHLAIERVMQGACFADICKALGEMEDETTAAARAANFLATWLADGLITGIT
jgi:hypothetical protein